MGVNPLPTGGIYKNFTFDGETSASFGVHLTGEGVYNAPVRAVEMVNVPARNGAFALDQGYFENIEVTYTASIAADNEADFSAAVSDLRNFLCSKNGYCRLEDDYNPNEYRMAVYKSGLEVAQFRNITGEFDIVFDCKPQRFLKSGETAISVTSGDTITNPTRFNAHPLLEVKGHGVINIGNGKIEIVNEEIGRLLLANSTIASGVIDVMLDEGNFGLLENGDEFSVSAYSKFRGAMFIGGSANDNQIISATFSTSGAIDASVSEVVTTGVIRVDYLVTINDPIVFNKGTSDTKTVTVDISASLKSNGAPVSYTGSYDIEFIYNSAYDRIRIIRTLTTPNLPQNIYTQVSNGTTIASIYGYSTRLVVSDTIYIDLEIGEAYGNSGGVISNLNNIVMIPSELPTLASGANTITYDNTFTQFDIVPRWWKV